MAFSDNLKVVRKYYKVTQKELAAQTGIPYNTLVNYETRGKEPPEHVIEKIAKALHTSPDFLTTSRVYIDGETLFGEKTTESGEIVCSWIATNEENGNAVIDNYIWDVTKRTALHKIDQALSELNETGIEEAVKRVWELTEISKYSSPIIDDEKPIE